MKNLITLLIVVLTFVNINSFAQENFTLVHIDTEDQAYIEASYFKVQDSKKAIIFAHGAIFNKESWYFLAEMFQKKGISGLSIDFRGYGNSTSGETDQKYYDILGAIEFLKGKGYSEINLIGGSMGGAATLMALSKNTDITIKKVLLLAPAGGPAIESTLIDKYFIVSKGERLFERVQGIYKQSSDPKHFKPYEGNAHAQHIFKEDYKDELVEYIIHSIL